MIFAGIDYSLSSTAICIHNDKFNPNEIDSFGFHFFIKSPNKFKKIEDTLPFNFHPHSLPSIDSFANQSRRYKFLSDWTVDILKNYMIDFITLEDYSFGSTGGSIFQIAENGGVLKYVLDHNSLPDPLLVAPTQLKKWATSKGNANKSLMEESFIKRTGFDQLRTLLLQTDKQDNPSSDIIDAYFLCLYGAETQHESQLCNNL